MCQFLGDDSDTRSACDGSDPDISAVNAQFTSYAALSAGGFNELGGLDGTDYLASGQVAEALGASGSPVLDGGIVFSMGCHEGLTVPDGSALGADAGLYLLDVDRQCVSPLSPRYLDGTGLGVAQGHPGNVPPVPLLPDLA